MKIIYICRNISKITEKTLKYIRTRIVRAIALGC